MMNKQQKRYQRHRKIRSKVTGTSKRPRLCVFRSNRYIYAQLIDDEKGHTILSLNDLKLKKLKTTAQSLKLKDRKIEDKQKQLSGKVAVAYEVGKLIAKEALEKGIKKVVFDRVGYKYHGRVKALAEGARDGGLKF